MGPAAVSGEMLQRLAPSSSTAICALPVAVSAEPCAVASTARALKPVRRLSPAANVCPILAGFHVSEPAIRAWTRPEASLRVAA